MVQPTFGCNACLRRSLFALFSIHQYTPAAHSSARHWARSFAVSAANLQEDSGSLWDHPSKKAAKSSLLARSPPSKSTALDELTERQKANLKSELKYLTDPLKLANHVQHVLEHDDVDKALALVRLSSRAVANIVSWNHLLDWHMKKGKTKAAFDVYNEMKKRSQKPDSYTYLLLLRGLADHAQHPHSLGRALSLYHSMSAPGNKVAPTIRHTNAVLKVCARANDMDSLWDIASRLPERGPHAADHWTFTTILNNIRLNGLTGGIIGEETEEDTARRRNEAVVQGRRLWELVIKRWRAGDIKVDEELTCSMGRLLLIGSHPRDWDDVLSLVNQTMNIPRLIPHLGTTERQTIPAPRLHAAPTSSEMKNSTVIPQEFSNEYAPTDAASASQTPSPSPTTDIFDPSTDPSAQSTTNPTVKRNALHAYAKPGNSTLSLVLESCLKLRIKSPANAYWNLLTNPTTHALIPDLDNFHMRLRILRQSHSSAEVLSLIRDDLLAAKVKPMKKTFAIAMAACARDSRNVAAVDAAGRILDFALQYLNEPSATTLRLYLDTVEACAKVAEKTPPTSTSGVGTDTLNNIRLAVRIQLHALHRLEPGTIALRSMLNFGFDPGARPSGRSGADWDDEVKRERADATNLMKRMVAMYDRVMGLCQGREREMGLGVADRRKCIERKKKLQAFVQRQHQRAAKRVIATNGWRGVRKVEGRSGWRVGGMEGDEVEVESPRRLGEVMAASG